MVDWIALIISLGSSFGAAAIGGILTARATTQWYQKLRKPWFTPPDWAFGPVWTALYALMAVSAYLVWEQSPSSPVAVPLSVYAVQLIINVMWSYVFFFRRMLRGGFAVIIALWFSILLTLVLFSSVSMTAGLLLVPYLAWVSIASALNFRVWKLNPEGASGS